MSEVRSYTKPPSGVLEVMQAAFLLLGFEENDLQVIIGPGINFPLSNSTKKLLTCLMQTWRNIQVHLGKGGTDSFRYRVIKRDPHVINGDVVKRASEILSGISLDGAQSLSLLVNLFYR